MQSIKQGQPATQAYYLHCHMHTCQESCQRAVQKLPCKGNLAVEALSAHLPVHAFSPHHLHCTYSSLAEL